MQRLTNVSLYSVLILLLLFYSNLIFAKKQVNKEISTDKYHLLSSEDNWIDYTNRRVILIGRKGNVIWQHIVGSFRKYPYSEYIDCVDSQPIQIVVYFRKPFEYPYKTAFYGMLFLQKAQSKQPNKTGEDFSEFQLRCDKYYPIKE